MNRGWPLVWALAAAQLVSWGSIYYSFSLFVVPTVMALGSLVGAVLFAAWSRVDSLALFYAIWLGLGLALAATLYEPVFAVVTRAFPGDYRTRITALTLVGGFASTVFIPLTQLFIDQLGWRGALVALGVCNALIALPVHALLLRDGARAGASDDAARAETQRVGDAALQRALRHPAFWALAICFTAYYATFSAMTFHIIPLLAERRVPTAIIVAAIATIGPAQVAGRIALLALGRRFSTPLAGRIAFLGLPCSALPLLALPTSIIGLFAFAAIYGAANGIITIIRGTAVPDLLWREGYGAINGALTLPANVARAAAPFGAALVWSAAGSYDAVLWSILLGGVIAAIGFWLAAARAEPRAR